jgi:hypothetical protein
MTLLLKGLRYFTEREMKAFKHYSFPGLQLDGAFRKIGCFAGTIRKNGLLILA